MIFQLDFNKSQIEPRSKEKHMTRNYRMSTIEHEMIVKYALGNTNFGELWNYIISPWEDFKRIITNENIYVRCSGRNANYRVSRAVASTKDCRSGYLAIEGSTETRYITGYDGISRRSGGDVVYLKVDFEEKFFVSSSVINSHGREIVIQAIDDTPSHSPKPTEIRISFRNSTKIADILCSLENFNLEEIKPI